MAVKTYTIANFRQSSTWTVVYDPLLGANRLSGGVSISTLNKSVTFSGIPTGATINSAVLTATMGSTAYRIRQLDGAHFSGSRNVISKVTPGASVSFEFKFQGSGSTSTVGTQTAYLAYSNIKITVDYTEPASRLTLNKTTMKAGDTIRCTITPASTTVTHKVKFAMTGISTVTSATIPAGTKIYDYTIPKAWQNAFPNNATRTVTVTLETYSGANLTGEATKTFTLTLSDDAYPSIMQFDITRIPGFVDEDIIGYVQGFSQVQVQSAATGAYSSTISQYKVTVGGWSGTGANVTSPVISGSGNIVVTLQVTDSRGRKATQTQTIAVLPYSPPSLVSPSVYRSDVSGNEAIAGTYVRILTGIRMSLLGGDPDVNVGTLKARVYEKGAAAPGWDDVSVVALDADVAEIISGMDITKSYTVDIQATDRLGEYVFTTEISTAKALISGLANVAGVAIGKYAETANTLEIGFDTGWLGSNPIATYRIGSLFFTFEDESPADLFDGTTWEKLTSGKFLVAGDTTGNYIPDDETYGTGGEATHALSTAEMPSHRHGTAARSGAGSLGAWARIAYPTNSGTEATMYTDYQGSGNAHNNMPPWIAIYIWRRTA